MDKAVSGAWRKAVDGFQFSIRRLDKQTQEELTKATIALMNAQHGESWREGWNFAIGKGWGGKASPASGQPTVVNVPAPIVNIPPVELHIDKGALTVPVTNHVHVAAPNPNGLDILRDSSGNVIGARPA